MPDKDQIAAKPLLAGSSTKPPQKTPTDPPQQTIQDQADPLIADKSPDISKPSKAKPKRSQDKPNRSFRLGRPSKYDPKFCKGIIDFFTQDLYTQRIKSSITQKNGSVVENYELVPNPPIFLAEYGYSIGVDQRTLQRWAKLKPDFSLAFTRAKEISQEHIIKLANMGLFNSNFATFTMKNISQWRDKKDLELSGKVDSQIFFAEMVANSQSALENESQVIGKNRIAGSN